MLELAEFGNGELSYDYPDLSRLPTGLIERTHRQNVKVCLRAGDTIDNIRAMMKLGLDYIPSN